MSLLQVVPFLWSAEAMSVKNCFAFVDEEMVSLTRAHLLGRKYSLYVYKYSENKARKRIIGSGFVSMKLLDCTWCILYDAGFERCIGIVIHNMWNQICNIVKVQPLIGLLSAHLCLGMVDRVVLDHTEVPKYEVQGLQGIEGWQQCFNVTLL